MSGSGQGETLRPQPPGGSRVTRFVTRAGHRLSYESSGEAEAPPLLALHDLLADRGQLRPLGAALSAAGFRVTLPDARGHGASAMISESRYPPPELAADALAVLDAEGVAATHVVAVGWGAAIALELAARHPDRVRSVTLIEPYLPALLQHHPNATAREYGDGHLKVFVEAIDAAYKGLTDRALDLFPGVRWGAGWRERTAKPRLGAIRRAAANLRPLLAGIGADQMDQAALRSIQAEVTVLVRADSDPFERWNAEAVALLVPGSGIQTVTIPHPDIGQPVIAPEWTPVLTRTLSAQEFRA